MRRSGATPIRAGLVGIVDPDHGIRPATSLELAGSHGGVAGNQPIFSLIVFACRNCSR
jgi:hypothetical protein